MDKQQFSTVLQQTTEMTIVYMDDEGEITERNITVTGCSVRGGKYIIYADCHRRNLPRHFRLDRILACFPTATATPAMSLVPPGADPYVMAVAS